jgi:hypothetical protein
MLELGPGCLDGSAVEMAKCKMVSNGDEADPIV